MSLFVYIVISRLYEHQKNIQKSAFSEERLKLSEQQIIARYATIIRDKVQRNWISPRDAKPNAACDVYVKLARGGEVAKTSVKHCNSDSNIAFMHSLELAVSKASPLPLPSDPGLSDKIVGEELIFKFRRSTK